MPEHGLIDIEPGTALDPAGIVLASTASKIRTFLYEIAERTTNYRSLHSLTQQVEHQYHGRFLVELIQNAHDALFPEIGADQARIEIVMVDDEGPHGALYVANDGEPFSESNFVSLSQLGQSDKDPQKSIGNKGIGFRSVLEITNSPEVFSRLEKNSALFDGFCFHFSPDVLSDLAGPVLELAASEVSPLSPFGNHSLVDWDAKLLAKFRQSSARQGQKWLKRELSYLSPYLLPVPSSTESAHARLLMMEQAGFATVVRLPLKSEEARSLVNATIAQLPSDTVLFLDRACCLTLDCDGQRRQLSRMATRDDSSELSRQAVTITSGDEANEESYLIWERDLEVANASEEFRRAVASLPGKWPELRTARISLAVRVGETPADGLFSIFLPTLVQTGCAAHVNAPFFADMSRTDIDFDKQAYNRGLLEEIWKLTIDITRNELAEGERFAAGCIVDMLGPHGDSGAAQRWRAGIIAHLGKEGINLANQKWLLADDGWSTPSKVCLLPLLPEAVVFTEASLRFHATFSVLDPSLNSRAPQVIALCDMAGFSVSPSKDAIAQTAEAIAQALHAGGDGDWNAFWSEIQVLLEGAAEPLRGRHVLLGNDGELHAAGDDCAVFFIPRQGAGEDDDVLSESAIVDIPKHLRPHVAFLHSSITLYDPQNLRQQTPTRRFLEKTLVSRFRVQDIFSEVLIKRTPKLPVGLKAPESELCADILQWGLKLLSNLVGRGRGDRTVRLLENLALPCRGGWFEANVTSYGPGWPSTLGTVLQRYLSGSKSVDSRDAAKRLLLPPQNSLWRGAGSQHTGLLDAAGVISGLRLTRVVPSDWKSTFSGCYGAFELPPVPPPYFPEQVWADYRKWVSASAKPIYTGYFQYQMQEFFTVPGISEYSRFDEATKSAFMELVLNCMGKWPQGWDKSELRKTYGMSGSVNVQSPLRYALRVIPWVCVRVRDQESWHVPSERWHVPANLMRAHERQYEHLHPLPAVIANMLDQNQALASAMVGLGMPQYDPESRSASTRLLDALCAAARSSEVHDANVFLGQVRRAWTSFVPGVTQRFPPQLLISRGGRNLQPVTPSADHPVYLPDSSRSTLAALEQFDIPVLAIEPSDAKRLAADLVAAYRGGVVQTSALRLEPITDGHRWAEDTALSLQESELKWVVPLALTVAAHYGVNARGISSAKFAAQIQAFREARVVWCTTLTVALFSDEVKVAEPLAAAMWMAENKTLLATRASVCDARLLSESIASILERDDLEVPLKLLLRETGYQVSHEKTVSALQELRLSEAQLMEVHEQWSGSLRYIIELLLPLIALLQSHRKANGLLEVQSEDQLLRFLASCRNPSLDGDELVRLARECPDPFDFGLQCHKLFGDTAALHLWNDATVKQGGKALQDREASSEFDAWASQVKQPLRALLASAICVGTHDRTFRELLAELDGIKCPDDFAGRLWEVELRDVLAAYSPFFRGVGASASVLHLLEDCDTSAILSDRLAGEGVEVACDPVQRARDNRELLKHAVAKMQEIGLAWAVANDQEHAAAWEGAPETFLDALDSALATDAYLRSWNQNDVYLLLRALPRSIEAPDFWAAVDQSTTLAALQGKLGLTEDAVAEAVGKLSELKEEVRRRSKLVNVCGREFDGSEDNLGALWSHICDGLPFEAVSALSAVDLSKPLKLGSVPSLRSGRGSGGKKGSVPPRLPKATEVLIGLAGEIHAFRRLQAQYGSNVVTCSSWISSSSLTVFPENKPFADDGAGCDFRFAVASRTFFVEVKSSSGEDETFTLGSSEIKLAMELARAKSRKQRERFIILRVLNATSAIPVFQVLPNPYDERFQSLFDIFEAGARVRYRVGGGIRTNGTRS